MACIGVIGVAAVGMAGMVDDMVRGSSLLEFFCNGYRNARHDAEWSLGFLSVAFFILHFALGSVRWQAQEPAGAQQVARD
jgi:hypothetical protein